VTEPGHERQVGAALLKAMRHRRVTREFLDEPVSTADLETVIRAARWASSAGNRRIHRFLVIRSPNTIARLKPFAPGILGHPPALIVVTTDLARAQAEHVQFDRDMNSWIDVGTALMSMMLACEALGLGSCPATSFSQTAVTQALELPECLIPELILQIGYAAPRPPRSGRSVTGPTAADLTDWEKAVGQRRPAADDADSSARS
jgi:nitroreductase